jgi:hypothetical protein
MQVVDCNKLEDEPLPSMMNLRIRDGQIQELSYHVLSFILQPLFGEDGWPEAGGWGGVDNGES